MSLYFSSGALKSATICFVALLSVIFPLPESFLTHEPWKNKKERERERERGDKGCLPGITSLGTIS